MLGNQMSLNDVFLEPILGSTEKLLKKFQSTLTLVWYNEPHYTRIISLKNKFVKLNSCLHYNI